MDLVDEQHVAGLQAGEDRRQIADALDRRPGGDAHADLHLGGDDVGERRLAEAGRAVQQHVVERLAALPRRLDADRDVVLDLLLVDVLVEAPRPQRCVRLHIAVERVARDHTRLGGIRSVLLRHRGIVTLLIGEARTVASCPRSMAQACSAGTRGPTLANSAGTDARIRAPSRMPCLRGRHVR